MEAPMAEPLRDLNSLHRFPSDERLRALERIISIEAVQQTLQHTGHHRRHYDRLPAWFVTWFVVALSLFSKDSYRQVFKHLQRFQPGGTPGRNTLAQARQSLGCAPLRLLARRVVGLLGTPDTPGAFYRGLRLMALDGFVLDLPDTPANERVFGRPQSGRSPGAFPQARVLALCETGSHVLYRWQVKPCRRGEVSMTAGLLRHLEADMLLLWDRAFFSYDHVRHIRARGAHLLARVKKNLVLPVQQTLADGSYLSQVYPSARDREHDRHGVVVRVIEYTLDDPSRGATGVVHRLVTTLLDAPAHPAAALIVLYHERWEEELTIDEVKTHQKERPVLRSQTPGGVIQEIDGLLLAHYVVRRLMSEAAERQEIDPRRLSFTGTLKVLRCRLPEVPESTDDVTGRQRWWERLLAEVGEEVLPVRRARINPRVIKRKMSKWAKKRPHHRQHPQPSKPFRETIVIT
jgi:Insertion element 4 transposase N-terminal/Transposase DDE domain